MNHTKRHFQDQTGHYFLFGPRGTGKSTWLKHNLDSKTTLFIDLLAPDLYRTYLAHPEKLRMTIESYKDLKIVVIDEVQRVPELLTLIHKLIEEHPEFKFVLTGSSSRKLKQSGVDLLAGRAIKCSLHPFMLSECPEHFSLEKSLDLGLIPLVITSKQPQKTLNSYIDLYLREEIQNEGYVRHLSDFNRFLESISFSHAEQINHSEIARSCHVDRKTVVSYISILEDLLLAGTVPVFQKRAKRHLSQHSKFYFFDCGVFKSIRPQGPLDDISSLQGQLLEGLVYQHLMAWISYRQKKEELFFWRTQRGSEVDFVLYGHNTFTAIEVKHTREYRASDLKGLKAFGDDYPEAQLIFLYRGTERLLENGILIIPVENFLKSLTPDLEMQSM